MSEPRLESVQVMRGQSGPFSGVRLGDAMAYEFELDEALVPRPGMTRLERVYVLLDVGVQLSNPPYWRGEDAACWYVDLVTVSGSDGRFTVWDHSVDLIVAPTVVPTGCWTSTSSPPRSRTVRCRGRMRWTRCGAGSGSWTDTSTVSGSRLRAGPTSHRP
jgi:hypothetical protein